MTTSERSAAFTVLDQVEFGRPRRWFPTVASGRWDTRSTEPRFISVVPVHAKEMGSASTACGVITTGWARLWEFEFPENAEHMCGECRLVLGN